MDKYIHAIISAGIVLITFPFTGSIYSAAILSLIVGLVKEVIYDYLGGLGTPDIKDLYADLAGIAAGIGVIQAVYLFIK